MAVKDLVELAKEVGMTAAVEKATKDEKLVSNLTRAYAGYAFIPDEKIQAFKKRLMDKTVTRTGRPGIDQYAHYDTLMLVDIGKYQGMPPADVLTKVKAAKATGIFDTFEVASIESVHQYEDPIVFGRIEGCTDRFYIAEWGADVSIADLMSGEPR